MNNSFQYVREETNDEYGIKALQERILEIAVYIDKLCLTNGIDYYLMGGSALGALRHKGFIPWDDDLDIFMKASDYEKFRRIFISDGDKNRFYLQELCELDGKVISAKLRLNGTTYIENATKEWKIHQGIFVDIFILHNTPRNDFAKLIQCLAAKILLVKGQAQKGVSYTGIKKIALAISKVLPFNMIKRISLRQLYRYDEKKTDFVCHYTGKAFYKKGLYDAHYFEHPERTQFEKVELNVPCDADKYLRSRFGDYMQMPSKEEITMVQHADIWDIHNDFSIYTNHSRVFSDEKKLV